LFKLVRTALFWTHLVIGVAAAGVILIMSITGVLLTYQRQMQYWADTSAFRAEPPPGAIRLPVDALIRRAEEHASTGEPAPVTTITFRSDPVLPVALVVGRTTLYANPYTGEVYGEGRGQRMRAFFSTVVNWHRWLALSGDRRATGRAITGAANLAFLFIVVSGMYLWWPRSLTWRQVRNVTWFRRGLPGKARDFNWHNVIGFWSAIPLAVVVYSGVVISYPWASNGVYRMMGEAPPAQAGRGVGAPAAPAAQPTMSRTDLTALLEMAAAREPEWNILSLRVPASSGAPVTVTIDRGDGGQPHLRDTVTFSGSDGAVVSAARFQDQTPGRQVRSLLRFAHTGEAAGLTGQTIAGLASAASVVLVYTGLALSWRRGLTWWRRRRESRQAGRLTSMR
jgi:uncharacterized iron-regulated membrane protein